MSRFSIILACFLIMLIKPYLHGQIDINTPYSKTFENNHPVSEYMCEKFDIENEIIKSSKDTNGLFTFAKKFYTNLDSKSSGNWYELNDMFVWKLKITSENAKSLLVLLSDLSLSNSSKIFIYDDSGVIIFGPFTKDYIGNMKDFYLPIVKGSSVTL